MTCVCVRERERERERAKDPIRTANHWINERVGMTDSTLLVRDGEKTGGMRDWGMVWGKNDNG